MGTASQKTIPAVHGRRWDIGGWLVVTLVALGVVVVWRSLQPGAGTRTGEPDAVPWRVDHSDAFRDARDQGKPAFVYFTADWCPPCREMKAHVYNRADVAELLDQRFVPIKVDMTAPAAGSVENRLAAHFSIQYLPTMLVLSSDGQVVGSYQGSVDAAAFTAWLRRSLAAEAAPAALRRPAG